MEILGIDIGGSAIKGAIVNTVTGELLSERIRIENKLPVSPKSIADSVKALTTELKWKGKIGCGFPAVVMNGSIKTATNIDKKWIGLNAENHFKKATGCPVKVVNDADAAGFAEIKLGAGKDKEGVILVMTLGTGIGSALFIDGKLVPNTEFGQLIFRDDIAEKYASASAKDRLELSWKKWGKRINKYLCHVEKLVYPDLIILGGGISKDFEKFSHMLTTECEVTHAQFYNNAGIIGAAMSVSD
jgi:polyphosphate glucokinase